VSDAIEQFSLNYITNNVPKTIAHTRTNLRLIGWARTKVLEVRRTPSPSTPGYEEVTIVIEARGSRTADLEPGQLNSQLNPAQWQWLRQHLRPGVSVRTLAEGYNFAAGIRHVMPTGSIGVVVGHHGAAVRVRFVSTGSHTFTYGPLALSPIGTEETR
jgi:hypothetical protein